jgi:hypothetical protein
MKNVTSWIGRNSTWLVGAGLMLASSGLDGVYMALWMPGGFGWLGLVLNTVADIADMKLGYEYAKLQRQRNEAKRQLAVLLLFGELVAIAYSWFFSWRQLRRVMPLVEPDAWRWVAPIAAGFIPLLLAFLGAAQALSETSTTLLTSDEKPAESKPEPKPEPLAEPEPAFVCDLCGYVAKSQLALNGHKRAHSNGNGHREPQPEQVREN